MKRRFLIAFCGLFILMPKSATSQTINIDKKVNAIIARMTLEEKVGQMTQITLDVVGNGKSPYSKDSSFAIDKTKLRNAIVNFHVGSILNTTNNFPLLPSTWNTIIEEIQQVAIRETRMKIPVIYGYDAIHGGTFINGATIFPHQINIAASFDVRNAYNMAAISAYETKACGIPWNFSPVLDLGADPRFARQYEGFGEDPYLISEMGKQMVFGYEGITDSIGSTNKVAACMKHFLGYSVPFSGKDRTPAYIQEYALREYHLPPFKAAVEAGVETVMINSGIINGIPVHANNYIVTRLLKEELKFKGFVVSDWADVINLQKRDRIAKTNKEAIKLAINAGIDMSMVPNADDFENFYRDLIALVKDGEVKESRIDDAVRRILKVKMKLGLWETPVTKSKNYPLFGSKEYAKLSYNAATDGITLLKNIQNILPLNKTAKVLVTGPNANNMRSLNGGWTYSWQGEKTDDFAGIYNTIFEAIQLKIGKENVEYIPGVSYATGGKYYEEKEDQFAEAILAAHNADVVVLCAGENSYAELLGDLNDLNLSELQIRLAKELTKAGKPVVLVLSEGRPRCINAIEPQMQAIVQAYLPGNYGGDALADILYGDVNPSGKLPYTYPAFPNSIVNYYHKYSEEKKTGEGVSKYELDYNPQYEFGFGLSYTTFQYANLKVSKETFTADESIEVSVEITNTGKMTGKEAVLLFTSDLYASLSPDTKRLRRFDKISLQPGETKTVKFNLSALDLAFVNTDNKRITEPGEFEIKVEKLVTRINYK